MKIKDLRNGRILRIKDFEAGTVFSLNGFYYIKADVGVVNLESGFITTMPEDTTVEKVDAELIIR